MAKLVYGAGRYEKGLWKCTLEGKLTFEYGTWVRMLRRCYDTGYQEDQPTYVECTVSSDFLEFQAYAEWACMQKGFRQVGWQLDKDLLLKGNKIYSESTCLFLPEEINKALTTRKALRGSLPIGVEKHGRWYRAKVSSGGQQERFGPFSTKWEAFECYQREKKRTLHELAENYRGHIDRRAYEALINYEIGIGD